MEADGPGHEAGVETVQELRHQIHAILERTDRAEHELEALQNRINTLVRLLDLVGRRIDRLEATK